jgi:PAS domain S-box-containing protein
MDSPLSTLLRRIAPMGGPPDETVSRRVMARTGSLLFGAGATIIGLSLAVPHSSVRDEPGIIWVVAIAYGIAVTLWIGGPRLPYWAFQIAAVAGTILISDAIYFTGQEESGYAFFYLWVALYSFYFFPTVAAVGQIVLIGAGYALALGNVGDGSLPADRWLITVGTVGVAGAFVAALVHRVRRNAHEAAERAEALRVSEQLTRAIVESAHEAFISVDPGGAIVDWNQQAAETFGWAREEALGRSVVETLIPERHRPFWDAAFEQIRASGDYERLDRRVEFDAVHRDGHELPVEGTMTRVDVGQSYSLNAFVHDISERRRAADLELVQHGVTRVLSEASTIEEAAPLLLAALCTRTHWQFGAFWRANESGRELSCIATWTDGGDQLAALEETSRSITLPAGVGLPGRVWGKGEPTWIADLRRDSNLVRADEFAAAGMRSAVALPVISGTRPFGVFEFLTWEPRAQDDRLIETLATISTQVGHFVARRDAERQAIEHAQQLSTVAEATRELARMTEMEAARPTICEAAVRVSGATWAVLFEPAPDSRGLRVTARSSDLVPTGLMDVTLPFVGSQSATVGAFTSREPVFIGDTTADDRVSQELVQLTGAVSALLQPVVRQDHALGVLVTVWAERIGQLPDRVSATMRLLAAEAAVAIERADLLARLETVARTDDLTGLANRRAWDEELPRELARARRDEAPGSARNSVG